MNATLTATTRPRMIAGPLLSIGGLLWIGVNVLIVANGFVTGTLPTLPDASSPPLLRLGIRLFAVSVVILGLGLWSLAAQLRGRWLKIAGLAIASVAMAFTSINLVTLSGLAGVPSYSDTLGGLSVMLTSLATLLLGIGLWRTQGASRRAVAAMLFIGVTTIPILFGTPLPVGPDWATDFLAFLTSGAAFLLLGLTVRSSQ